METEHINVSMLSISSEQTLMPSDVEKTQSVASRPAASVGEFIQAPLYAKLKLWKPGEPTVVLVESMDSIRRELEYFIRQTILERATVTPCKSASRAWDFIRENACDVDLVVTDNRLGERSMSGYELIVKLRSDQRTQHIPVVMLTLVQDRTFRRQCIEAGVTAFFIKPIDKVLAPELFSGLMRQTRAHRKSRQALESLLAAIGDGTTIDELQLILGQGVHRLVAADDWEKLSVLSKAMETLAAEMKKLMGVQLL